MKAQKNLTHLCLMLPLWKRNMDNRCDVNTALFMYSGICDLLWKDFLIINKNIRV